MPQSPTIRPARTRARQNVPYTSPESVSVQQLLFMPAGIYRVDQGQPVQDLCPDGSYVIPYEDIQKSTYNKQVLMQFIVSVLAALVMSSILHMQECSWSASALLASGLVLHTQLRGDVLSCMQDRRACCHSS